jgi:hypothetical protein
MRPPIQHGSTLSVQRAFVVHFGAGRDTGRRRFRGRVEHLASGESAEFTSLEALLAFFGRERPPVHGATVAVPHPVDARARARRQPKAGPMPGAQGAHP